MTTIIQLTKSFIRKTEISGFKYQTGTEMFTNEFIMIL